MEKNMSTLYEKDFYGWCRTQADRLRSGSTDLDLTNLAEEIESLGRSEKKELINRLTILICHMLKWECQVERRSRSWENTIMEQKQKINELLEENPSLRHSLESSIEKSMKWGRWEASKETGLELEKFPSWIEINL